MLEFLYKNITKDIISLVKKYIDNIKPPIYIDNFQLFLDEIDNKIEYIEALNSEPYNDILEEEFNYKINKYNRIKNNIIELAEEYELKYFNQLQPPILKTYIKYIKKNEFISIHEFIAICLDYKNIQPFEFKYFKIKPELINNFNSKYLQLVDNHLLHILIYILNTDKKTKYLNNIYESRTYIKKYLYFIN